MVQRAIGVLKVNKVHVDLLDQGDTGPQGLPGNNGLNGKRGATGPQGEQGPPGQIKLGKLIVSVHVINANGGNAMPSNYTININGYNQIPDTFLGSEKGTSVILGFGSLFCIGNTKFSIWAAHHWFSL